MRWVFHFLIQTLSLNLLGALMSSLGIHEVTSTLWFFAAILCVVILNAYFWGVYDSNRI